MSNFQKDEQDELQKHLEEKAKQEQELQKEKESQSLSAYDACVLKESAKIHELVAKAQGETPDSSKNE
ncbi:hypothetical protein ACT3TH_05860 [Psychrobacter sp. AOP22-C1-C5]|uniref:hypothetical protein n=1 Tax=Psychrobacter sp. AOP22-C1-C5 TaxID=3457716 RepID=UPI004037064C